MKNLINVFDGLKEGEFSKAFHKNAIEGTTNIHELLQYAQHDVLKRNKIFLLIGVVVLGMWIIWVLDMLKLL